MHIELDQNYFFTRNKAGQPVVIEYSCEGEVIKEDDSVVIYDWLGLIVKHASIYNITVWLESDKDRHEFRVSFANLWNVLNQAVIVKLVNTAHEKLQEKACAL